MTETQKKYYEERARKVIASLKKNNVNACYMPSSQEALAAVMEMVPPGAKVACGDSITLETVGVIRELRRRNQNELTNPMERDENGHYLIPDREQRAVVQRQAFTADVYLSGTNAVTLGGDLVNIDGGGNRVAPMVFGPRKVILVVGGNKIVTDVDEALERIHDVAAPMNAIRHLIEHGHTEYTDLPCVRTGSCHDCESEYRICRATVILHGTSIRNRGRVNVVIVGEELGL